MIRNRRALTTIGILIGMALIVVGAVAVYLNSQVGAYIGIVGTAGSALGILIGGGLILFGAIIAWRL